MTNRLKILLATCTSLTCSVPGSAEVKLPGQTLSIGKFAANIEAAMAPVTVGWAYSIAKDGKPVAAKGGGLARTKLDGARAHGPAVRQNIASVSKTVTAVATLQLLAELKLTPDAKITPFLPFPKKGPNIDDLSFADLLAHTSGIVSTKFNSVDLLKYEAVQGWVEKGTTKRPYVGGVRPAKYDNMNYALLRVLIPNMWAKTGANLNLEALKMYDQLPAMELGDPNLVGNWNAYTYIAYVQQHVLGPIGVKNALCSDTTSVQTLYYAAGGKAPGQKSFPNNDWTRACGSGGWYLSANDLTNLMVHLRHTEKLLPAAYRTQMFDRLFGVRRFATTGGTGWTKDGIVGAGNGAGLRACTMTLPGGIEVSAVENSSTVVDLDVCKVLNDSYKASFV